MTPLQEEIIRGTVRFLKSKPGWTKQQIRDATRRVADQNSNPHRITDEQLEKIYGEEDV
jgi:hypothetical protein